MVLLSPDLDSLRETYQWLGHSDYGCTEIRIIETTRRAAPLIAYVDNADSFIEICAKNNHLGNVYCGIQPRPIDLMKRAPNRVVRGADGANVEEIEVVTATVFDIDPVRPKDTASTDLELGLALEAAEIVAARLVVNGYRKPELICSGNGVQLWIAFPAIVLTPETRSVVQENLRLFEAQARTWIEDMRATVRMDSIHDLARIIKAIGSVSMKGEPTEERPHRLSGGIGGGSLAQRGEDPQIAERMLEALPEKEKKGKGLPLFQPGQLTPSTSSPGGGTTSIRKKSDGTVDYKRPVEMCSPIERLWDEGYSDRSLAIFNMILWLLSRGLSEEDVEFLCIAYDAQGLRKLENRDAHRYLQREIQKAINTSGGIEKVKPPCHSMQEIGLCPVNKEPGAVCDLYDLVFSVETAILKIPENVGPEALPYRLKGVIQAMLDKPAEMQAAQIRLISKRFGVEEGKIRGYVDDALVARAFDGGDGTSEAEAGEAEPEEEGEPSSAAIDGQIVEDAFNYLVVSAKGNDRIISSFTLRPKVRVETPEDIVFQCDAHCDNGLTLKNVHLPLAAFASKRALIEALPNEHLQWTGSDNNVQGLLRQISRRRTAQKLGVFVLGEAEVKGERFWTLPDRILSERGIEEDPPIVYIPTGNPLDSKLRYDETDEDSFHAIAYRILDLVLKINSPGVILPILGWFFATPLKQRLMKSVGSFPMLWVHGTRGSGKTALLQHVFWPMFGAGDSAPYSSNPTEFALTKTLCQTNSIPIFLDEYKQHDQSRILALHRVLRESYTGEVQTRGQRNLSVAQYRLSAPLCIAGEGRPSEAAILERVITSQPDKIELEENEEWRENFKSIRTVDLTFFAPRYIRFCLRQELEPNLLIAQKAIERVTTGITKHIPIRVRNNLTTMALGVHLFEEFAKEIGYHQLPSDLGLGSAVNAVISDLIETDAGVKDPLDHFLETIGVMGISHEILHRRHFVWAPSGILCLHWASCYDAYQKHCRMIDHRGERLDSTSMWKLVEQNFRRGGYVRALSEKIAFDSGDSRNALWIDVEKTDLVEKASFPADDVAETYSRRGSGNPARRISEDW